MSDFFHNTETPTEAKAFCSWSARHVLTLGVILASIYSSYAGQHPDCRDPNIGSSRKLGDGKCHWKYYLATNKQDTELNVYGSCIGCYSNACFDTNSDRCRKECNKYWRMCVNYTAPVQTTPPRYVYTTVSTSKVPEIRPPKEGDKPGVGDDSRVVSIVVPVAVVIVLAPIIILSVVYMYRSRQANSNNGRDLRAHYFAPPQPLQNEGRVELGAHYHTQPVEEAKVELVTGV